MTDRFGLGWRPELAAGIFAHLDRLDVVEVRKSCGWLPGVSNANDNKAALDRFVGGGSDCSGDWFLDMY